MNGLVFLEPNKIDAVPFTTSDVIAEHAQIKHHAIQVTIQKYESDLKEFGKVSFEMRASVASKTGQSEKIYHLNEEQATLLITYLKNTEPVRKFKKDLVKQFYLMRSELQKRKMLREQLKPIRRELTDVIKDKPDAGKWAYKLYTDLAYKTALGKNAAQVRKERSAPKKATAIDYMSSDEIAAISKLQSQIGVLLEMGMDYQQVKMLLLNRKLVGNIA